MCLVRYALLISGLVFSQAIAAEMPELVSMQMRGVELNRIAVDADEAAERLAQGIRFATISHQDRSNFDEQTFSAYHEYLQKVYPKVHATLSRELVGEKRKFSLLYTWQGSDPSLAPVVLMALPRYVVTPPSSDHSATIAPPSLVTIASSLSSTSAQSYPLAIATPVAQASSACP